MKRLKNILIWVVIVCLVLWAVHSVLMSYVFVTFMVPSDSMLPTIKTGQHVLVNCRTYGLRTFECNIDSIRHGCIKREISNIQPQHNDIAVFNNPYCANWEWDSVSFNKQKYLVKRCIALPGDTFEIHNGYYHVRGYDEELGNVEKQSEVEQITKDSSAFDNPEISYWTAPFHHPIYHWNIREMGPLYVPKKGDTIILDTINAPIYKKLIEWEIDKDILEKDGCFYVDGKPFISHVMEQGYYFMAGDYALYSIDSRYLGLVPEEFIVGKVVLVY